jgi:CheY-like chemotaxis protein
MPLPEEQISKNKNAAKQCMIKADQFIKESNFAEAKAEVQKAKALDPSNVYINAFIDRINYFEEQKKAEQAKKEKELSADLAAIDTSKPDTAVQSNASAATPPQNKEVNSVNPPVQHGKAEQKSEKQILTQKPAPAAVKESPAAPIKKVSQSPVVPPKPPSVPPQAPVTPPKPPVVPPQSPVASPKPPVAVPQAPVAIPKPPIDPPQPTVAPPKPPVAAHKSSVAPSQSPVAHSQTTGAPQAKIVAVEPEKVLSKPTVPLSPIDEKIETPPSAKISQTVPPQKITAPPLPSAVTTTPAGSPANVKPAPQKTAPVVPPAKVIIPAKQNEEILSDVPVVTAASSNIYDQSAEKQITAQQLAAMKKQIEKLSLALEQEKIAREEMHQQKVQQNIPLFRATLQNAWIDGAPSDLKKTELLQLARSMAIPDALFNSLQREVKIEMYGRAVKEVIAKRRVIRHSSSTLDWLRKVYQITMEEYVEYESKFLLDLVADQYKGIILQISSDDDTRAHISAKLKSAGFAVIFSRSPEDALEKIDQLNPNLILCESSFGPGSISGIRFLHILRTNSKYNFVPFILLSSVEDHAVLSAAELKPNEGFLVKPVDDEELSAMINGKLSWFKEYVMSLSQ